MDFIIFIIFLMPANFKSPLSTKVHQFWDINQSSWILAGFGPQGRSNQATCNLLN
jgi:hypothetical protein